jgi:glucokinase
LTPRGVNAAAHCASAQRAILIGSAPIKNARNSLENNALNFSNRLKMACFGARFLHVLRSKNHHSPVTYHAARSTNHQSLLTNRAFLIASRQILKIRLTRSQQTRKLFLVASFSAISTPAPRPTHHSSIITHHCLTSFLFDTNKTHKIIILVRALMKTKENQFSTRYKFAVASIGNPTCPERTRRACAFRCWRREFANQAATFKPAFRSGAFVLSKLRKSHRGYKSLTNRIRKGSSLEYVLGVDIGGTKVAVGLVNSRGQIRHAARAPMAARGSAEEGFHAVLNAIDGVMPEARAAGVPAIGVCVPGWVESERGVLLSATNLPCWRNFPLARKIEKHYGLPTRLTNDASAAALAEAKWGAGAGHESIFYVSLGTGIGTAIVRDGKIYHGRAGGGCEGGHMTVNFSGPLCGCGKRGCVEMYASGTAISRRARSLLGSTRNKQSRMLKMAGGKISDVTTETVNKAARSGDKLAREVLEEASDHLAVWLGNIIDLLEPEVIIVGGGIGRVMTSFRGRMGRALETWAINPGAHRIPILNARYGVQSALAGAAALWLATKQR